MVNILFTEIFHHTNQRNLYMMGFERRWRCPSPGSLCGQLTLFCFCEGYSGCIVCSEAFLVGEWIFWLPLFLTFCIGWLFLVYYLSWLLLDLLLFLFTHFFPSVSLSVIRSFYTFSIISKTIIYVLNLYNFKINQCH